MKTLYRYSKKCEAHNILRAETFDLFHDWTVAARNVDVPSHAEPALKTQRLLVCDNHRTVKSFLLNLILKDRLQEHA